MANGIGLETEQRGGEGPPLMELGLQTPEYTNHWAKVIVAWFYHGSREGSRARDSAHENN